MSEEKKEFDPVKCVDKMIDLMKEMLEIIKEKESQNERSKKEI